MKNNNIYKIINKYYDIFFYWVSVIFILNLIYKIILWIYSIYNFNYILYLFIITLIIYIIKNYNNFIIENFKKLKYHLFSISFIISSLLYLYIINQWWNDNIRWWLVIILIIFFISSLFVKIDTKIEIKTYKSLIKPFIFNCSFFLIWIHSFLQNNWIKQVIIDKTLIISFIIYTIIFILIFSDLKNKILLHRKKILQLSLSILLIISSLYFYKSYQIQKKDNIIKNDKIVKQQNINTNNKNKVTQNNFNINETNLLTNVWTWKLISEEENQIIQNLFDDNFWEVEIKKEIVKKKIWELYKFERYLWLWSKWEDVNKLQEYLKIAWYYDNEITWFYDENTKISLRNFLMKEFWWPESTKGVFWPSANRDFSSFEIEVEE